MDNELFKKKLTEVANWGLPTLEQSTKTLGLEKHRRGRKPKIAEITDDTEDLGVIKDGTNVTYAPMITEVKIQSCSCPDCGKFCQNGRRTEAQLYFKAGKKFVREKCAVCKRHRDPYTGEFNLSPSQSSATWHKFMGEETAKKKLTPKQEIIKTEDGRWAEQQENDTEIIRKYLD